MKYWRWFFKCMFPCLILISIGENLKNINVETEWVRVLLGIIGGGMLIVALELYLYLSNKTGYRWYDDD